MRKIFLSIFFVLALALPSQAGMVQYTIGGYYSSLDGTTRYNGLIGGEAWDTTEANRRQLLPVDGTASNLFTNLTGAASGTVDVVLRNESGDSSVVNQITSGNSEDEDTTHTLDFSAGDLISISGVNAGSVVRGAWSLKLSLDNDKEGFTSVTSLDSPSTSSTEYMSVQGFSSWYGLESGRYMYAPVAFTAKKIYVRTPDSPGTGNYDFTVRKEGAGTLLTCNIDSAASHGSGGYYCTASQDVSFAKGDRITVQSIPNSSPDALSIVYIGIVADTGTNGESILFAFQSSKTTDSTEYAAIRGGSWNASESQRYQTVAGETKFQDLYVIADAGPGNGTGTVAIDLRDDGSDTALDCTLTDSDTECSESGPVTVGAGSIITYGGVSNADADTISIGVGMVQYNEPAGGGPLPQVIINAW